MILRKTKTKRQTSVWYEKLKIHIACNNIEGTVQITAPDFPSIETNHLLGEV